jgi:hypothetical protein
MKKAQIKIRVNVDKPTLKTLKQTNQNLSKIIKLLKLNGELLVKILDRSLKIV